MRQYERDLRGRARGVLRGLREDVDEGLEKLDALIADESFSSKGGKREIQEGRGDVDLRGTIATPEDVLRRKEDQYDSFLRLQGTRKLTREWRAYGKRHGEAIAQRLNRSR